MFVAKIESYVFFFADAWSFCVRLFIADNFFRPLPQWWLLIFQNSAQCVGLSLASLPTHVDQPNTTKNQSELNMHHSLTSILSHLFFMRMNWMTSTDRTCEEHSQIGQRRQRFRDLVESWQSLNCVYQRNLLGGDIFSTHSRDLQANIVRVLNTRISLYTTCQVRRVRDCILITEARAVLKLLEELYTEKLKIINQK